MMRSFAHWSLLLFLVSAAIAAPRELDLQIERLEGSGFVIEGFDATFDATSGSLLLHADGVRLGNSSPFSDVRIACPDARTDSLDHLTCERASVSLNHSWVTFENVAADIDWMPGQGGTFRLDGTPLLGDGVTIVITRQKVGWKVEIDAPTVTLAALGRFMGLSGLALSGSGPLHLVLDFQDGSGPRIAATLRPEGIAFQDSEGLYFGENLAGEMELSLVSEGNRWKGSIHSSLEAGEALTPFAYLEAQTDHPLEFDAAFDADSAFTDITLADFSLTHHPWVRLQGSAEIALGTGPALRRLDARMPSTRLGPLFERYVSPVVIHPIASALVLAGKVEGRVSLVDGELARLSLDLRETDVSADTESAGFGMEGLSAQLSLIRGKKTQGQLSWRSAHLFDIPFGEISLPLALTMESVELRAPAAIGVFDGSLDMSAFSMNWARQPPDVHFDAVLTPVSMEQLTTALGWTPMRGQLSGVIPRVSLSGGSLKVDGVLLIRAFDGDVVIRHLSVSDFLGYWPVLSADVSCNALDLEQLTGTYEFGRITGRIDGRIDGLRLENWRPVAFDARFETTPGDESPHRISQRAVDNIASLSGTGVSGILSRGFLRFLDDFRYDQLGIGCRLRNGVCEISGVAPAKQGYYLVKGGGIPRIDVIGFNRFTDWEVLLERLIAVTEGGPPVIK